MGESREVRRWLRLREHDQVVFIRRGNKVISQPFSETLLDLRGSIVVNRPQDFEEVRRRIVAEYARRVAENKT